MSSACFVEILKCIGPSMHFMLRYNIFRYGCALNLFLDVLFCFASDENVCFLLKLNTPCNTTCFQFGISLGSIVVPLFEKLVPM